MLPRILLASLLVLCCSFSAKSQTYTLAETYNEAAVAATRFGDYFSDGNYLYAVAWGAGKIVTYDIRNKVIASSSHILNFADNVALRTNGKIHNGYLYLLNDKGLHILDLTNPAQPVYVRTITQFEIDGEIENVSLGFIEAFDQHLYLTFGAGSNGVLAVLSLTNPASPSVVFGIPSNLFNTNTFAGFSVINSQDAFLAANGDIRKVNISNPSSIQIAANESTGSLEIFGSVLKMEYVESKYLIGVLEANINDEYVFVVDVPTMTLLDTLEIPSWEYRFAYDSDTKRMVVAATGQMRVIDLTNPSQLVLETSLDDAELAVIYANGSVYTHGNNNEIRRYQAGSSTSTLAANFTASSTAVQEGASVQFTDTSTGSPTSWAWTFEGGTPASSTSQNPTVTYSAAGQYDVSLVVSSGSSSDTRSVADYIVVSQAGGSVLEQDSLALVALYQATGGANWSDKTNWLSGAVETWYGVAVDQSRVVSLELGSNNLQGIIPPEIGNLHNLVSLNLSENELSGAIPIEVNALAELENLNLYYNQLSGNIPIQLAELTNLIYLNLGANQLSGFIPSEIGLLVNLNIFSLALNQLEGSIPKELGLLTSLTTINLEHNQLSGEIPVELAQIPSLSRVFLSNNLLSGAFPPEFGDNTSLLDVYIANNEIEDLPVLTGVNNLDRVRVENNQLTFEDLIPNRTLFSDTSYYNPQKPFGERQEIMALAGDDLVLDAKLPGKTSTDIFQWKKDGTLLANENAEQLEITNLTESDFGVYILEVTNPALPDLVLASDSIQVSLDDSNTPPEVADQAFEIRENSPFGTAIGTVAATDPDDDVMIFSIASGNTGDAFYIEESSGVIRVKTPEAIDFEEMERFVLEIEVDDSNGGTASANITIEVLDVEREVLGIADNLDIDIFPNPSRGKVTISSDTPLKAVVFSDLTGRRVKSLPGFVGSRDVDVSGLPLGIYVIKTVAKDAQFSTYRFIKK